jgi:hypothetical protein
MFYLLLDMVVQAELRFAVAWRMSSPTRAWQSAAIHLPQMSGQLGNGHPKRCANSKVAATRE